MEEEKYKSFVLDFFDKLGCEVVEEGGGYVVNKIPRAFSDLIGGENVCKFCFEKKVSGFECVRVSSVIGRAITKFLDNAGKMTLLQIELDVDPLKEIKKRLSLKNCSIENVTKRYRNNFFSRFSFMTTFSYLNSKEQVLNEIYIHDEKVVEGDLMGYKVSSGNLGSLRSEMSEELNGMAKKEFPIAREYLKELLSKKTSELSELVGERLDKEIERVSEYYKRQLAELGADLNSQLDRVREMELQMRFSEGDEKKELIKRIEKQRKGLLKMADDEVTEKILREQEFSLRDTHQKYSLDINNKVLNTTVIYYPVFSFNLFLKNSESKRLVELVYDPLIRDFENLNCDSCSEKISEILLCSNGHIVCEKCLTRCGECGKYFCKSCVSRSCVACGKALCKNCLNVCRGCSKLVCNTHLRTDCVSGEKRCVMCLRSCSRCHGVASEAHFGISKDGSKVCNKCLGKEKRESILKDVFD